MGNEEILLKVWVHSYKEGDQSTSKSIGSPVWLVSTEQITGNPLQINGKLLEELLFFDDKESKSTCRRTLLHRVGRWQTAACQRTSNTKTVCLSCKSLTLKLTLPRPEGERSEDSHKQRRFPFIHESRNVDSEGVSPAWPRRCSSSHSVVHISKASDSDSAVSGVMYHQVHWGKGKSHNPRTEKPINKVWETAGMSQQRLGATKWKTEKYMCSLYTGYSTHSSKESSDTAGGPGQNTVNPTWSWMRARFNIQNKRFLCLSISKKCPCAIKN